MIFAEAALESQARNLCRILLAIQLFFFDCEEGIFCIEENYGRTVAGSGNSEKVAGRQGQATPLGAALFAQ